MIGMAFVTMAIGVSARTAFSLHMPPLIDEFGWERSLAAGAFSFGFVVTAALAPFAGRLMDRFGPRLVIESGVALLGGGLLLAPAIESPWHPYVTLGVMAGAGANLMTYTAQSLYLEIFEGPHYGAIFGATTIALICGGAAGPWVAGVIHDSTGSYGLAFWLGIGCCAVSAAAICAAARGKIRRVPGRSRPVERS